MGLNADGQEPLGPRAWRRVIRGPAASASPATGNADDPNVSPSKGTRRCRSLLHHQPAPSGALRRQSSSSGYDGSSESRLALAVAVERAGPAGTVVPAYVTLAASSWRNGVYYEPAIERAHQEAETRLAEIAELETGSTSVTPELTDGGVARALIRVAQSRGAREIVVGSRGLGRIRAMLGSVSHALLKRSDRPVTIVPKGAVDVHH